MDRQLVKPFDPDGLCVCLNARCDEHRFGDCTCCTYSERGTPDAPGPAAGADSGERGTE